jgi:hypothetical protein
MPGESGSNEHADLGTAAHLLLEHSLVFSSHPLEFVGQRLDRKSPLVVTEEMAMAVAVAYEYVQEYLEDHGDSVRLHVERRVEIGPAFDVPASMCAGTSDVQIEHLDGSLLMTLDYKHGSGVRVDAKDNSQLMLYAAGGRMERGSKFRNYLSVIVQPRAARRRPIDEWEYMDGALNKWLDNTVRPSAHAALLPNAPRSAGPHCRWCRAAPVCSTYRYKARAIATSEFDPVEGNVVLKDPDSLTPADMAEILKEASVLESWIKTVRANALKYLQDGGQIPDYQLGWSKRRREWDDTAALEEYCGRRGLTPDDYMPRALLSPAGLTKLLRARKMYPRKGRGETMEPPNPLDAFVKFSIPRPAIVLIEEGGDDFTALDDDE